MYFEQFYLGCLAHASYMIGSEGVAAVIDPQRDVDIYLEAARENGLEIRYVIETHLHADFVSGHGELAARTGAAIYMGAGAGASFPHVGVRDGDELGFGRCILKFLDTPGHTLESISILVTDLDRSPEPFAVFTGDTLFVGDVGRPDLAKDVTSEQLAGHLYDSLFDKLLKLDDAVQVYPAHGAGSLCGRQLGKERYTTIGKERLTNYALQVPNKQEFVRRLITDLPPRPEYFAQDVERNRQGAQPITDLPELSPLSGAEIKELIEKGAIVLDTRPTIEFAAGHIPGSMHIGLSGQYASWAARLLGLDAEIIIMASDMEAVRESQIRLARVGVEKALGYVADGVTGASRVFELEQIPQVSVQELDRMLSDGDDSFTVLDVREDGEWKGGHLAAAKHIRLGDLIQRVSELDPGRMTVVHCAGGYRSSIATSLLRRAGFAEVANVTGGFNAWTAANLPVAPAVAAPA
jgi:glyoxylase-like metal-dependent hydrolase (beta-lactamase superfamily II)/rhodanese-related sulfurtransferase